MGADPTTRSGPLAGIRVLEIASLTPGPFAAMLLSDLGAEVLRVDRVDADTGHLHLIRPLSRGRRSIALDLKAPDDLEVLLQLVERADVLVEGFRPGVAERLGFGPEVAHARNPRLVFGRMTGWGQDGPRAQEAGHDINYLALAGALDLVGMAGERPVPPANMVAGLGGGGMLLALGVLAALLERERSGLGQVVDAAMVDGAALLTAGVVGFRAAGAWDRPRGENLLDGGAPFYRTYECADGRYVAVGALEPQFFAALLDGLGLDPADVGPQHDREGWSRMQELLAGAFAGRTRDEWSAAFGGRDACVTPVLSGDEVGADAHGTHRSAVVEVDGIRQPAPAPRFSRTPGAVQGAAPQPGQHTTEVLQEWGIERHEAAGSGSTPRGT